MAQPKGKAQYQNYKSIQYKSLSCLLKGKKHSTYRQNTWALLCTLNRMEAEDKQINYKIYKHLSIP